MLICLQDGVKLVGQGILAWIFLLRHPGLILRLPEAASLCHATTYNHHNVIIFFQNLNVYKIE